MPSSAAGAGAAWCELMKVRDAVKKVRAGQLPATVVLCGEEEYIRRVGVRELTAAAAVSVPELNIMTYEGRPPMTTLRDALGRPPFMSERKVVVLRNTDLFEPRTNSDLSRPLEKMVIEDHTLFILDAGEKLDQRKASVRHLLQSGMLIECVPLRGEALTDYIVTLARQRRLHITRTCAQSLAERCDDDLQVISSELDKLSFACEGEITAADLDRFCRPEPAAGMYQIQDLLLSGRLEEARQAVGRLLREDASPMGFLSLLAGSLRQMLIARTCRDARFPMKKTIDHITAATGARDWMARRAYDRCVRMSADQLRRGIRQLSRIDFGAKQGQYILASDLFALLCSIFAA